MYLLHAQAQTLNSKQSRCLHALHSKIDWHPDVPVLISPACKMQTLAHLSVKDFQDLASILTEKRGSSRPPARNLPCHQAEGVNISYVILDGRDLCDTLAHCVQETSAQEYQNTINLPSQRNKASACPSSKGISAIMQSGSWGYTESIVCARQGSSAT